MVIRLQLHEEQDKIMAGASIDRIYLLAKLRVDQEPVHLDLAHLFSMDAQHTRDLIFFQLYAKRSIA